MPAHKGHKKAGGRRKGSVNKSTASVKAALLSAFTKLGGVSALVRWGQQNPTEFYTLWGKLLPTEIKNADGAPFQIRQITEVVVRSREEADAVLALNPKV